MNLKRRIATIFVLVILIVSLVSIFNDIKISEVLANPNPNELRFAVVSDLHYGQGTPSVLYQLFESITVYQPDFIVDCGDWLGNDQHSSWNVAQDTLISKSNITIFHVMGNHDDAAYYSGDRDDDPQLVPCDEWADEAGGDGDTYAFLKDNVLFIFIGTGCAGNNRIRYRTMRFVEYLLEEKYPTQTWMFFDHNGMNATVGHQLSDYPQYKTGFWADTEVWFENLLATHGSRCLAEFMGHIHYELPAQNATWQYGTYHFPCGLYSVASTGQYFWLVNITAGGYSARNFLYDGTERTLARRDNTTFTTSYDNTVDDELLLPIWVQDGTPQGQLRIFTYSESRKLDLVGVQGNDTYINYDPWLNNMEADYNSTNPTLRVWQGRSDDGSYTRMKGSSFGGNWLNITHVINATTVPSTGWSALRAWSLNYGRYYNISIHARANQSASCGVHEVGSPPTAGQKYVNWTLTTSWAWYYSSSTSECVDDVPYLKQIGLALWDNATYYFNFLGWRPDGVTDEENTTDPSIQINGAWYNYTGTLNSKENYTFSSFPFPTTTYDNIQSALIDGSCEVMLVFRYINPTWNLHNAAISKSGSDYDTNTATSDYNATRVIYHLDTSPTTPQFRLLRGVITAFTEPSWASNTLTANVTGTGNGIFIVDCATSGNATSVTDNGSPIAFSYDDSAELIAFNVTLGSEHEIEINFGDGGQNLTFILEETVQALASASSTKEQQVILSELITILSDMGFSKEGVLTILETFSQQVNVVSSLITSIEEPVTPITPWVPPNRYDWDAETWYMRSDAWNVSTVYGYKLYDEQSDSDTNVESTAGSLSNMSVGVRVYRVSKAGVETEVTDGTPVAVATQDGLTSGVMKNATWTPDEEIDLSFDDAIEVNLYIKLGASSWVAKATFISKNLVTHKIENYTWTVHYYVAVINDAGTYRYRVHFGDDSHNSRIDGVSIADLDPWGTMLYYLGKGDLINFLLSPWTYHIGDMFYGLMLMFFAITSYNRYRSFRPLIVIFYLFGGVGGALTMLIPGMSLNISFLFLGLAIAITLYKLIR